MVESRQETVTMDSTHITKHFWSDSGNDNTSFSIAETEFVKRDLSVSEMTYTDQLNTSRVVFQNLVIWLRTLLTMLPVRLTLCNVGIMVMVLVVIMPQFLTKIIIYPTFRLLFGTLYPAYCSYKAVRTKNVKEYVKWMMYWIVFALFTAVETFTDVFFSFWFPFYYEIKIILVIYLLSPATKGSSILYRRFVHPALVRREEDIDEALAKAKEQGYTTILHLGTKGVNYATNVLMQTAIKNLPIILPASQPDVALSSSSPTHGSQQESIWSQCDGVDIPTMSIDSADSSFEQYLPKAASTAMQDFYFDHVNPEENLEQVQDKPKKKRRGKGSNTTRKTNVKTRSQSRKHTEADISEGEDVVDVMEQE